MKRYTAIKARAKELNQFENAIEAVSELLAGEETEGYITVKNIQSAIKFYTDEDDDSDEFTNELKSLQKFMTDEKIDFILY